MRRRTTLQTLKVVRFTRKATSVAEFSAGGATYPNHRHNWTIAPNLLAVFTADSFRFSILRGSLDTEFQQSHE